MLLANVGLKVALDHFYGIEIDEWPARIAETAMFLIDRQCDLKMRERFGVAPQRLPIQKSAKIAVGSALAIAWEDELPPSKNVVVAGNPPFLGISLRSAAQTAELKEVSRDRYHGTLDYVTGWHARALAYFGEIAGKWAFVTTNSITQGEAVAPLFRPILDAGWQIKFAHRTFKWTSEAPGQAAVHCVIIGFEHDPEVKRLFDYDSIDGAPVEVRGIKNITPYLTDGVTIIVDPAHHPLNRQMGVVAYGNKPTDGGWLIVDPEEAGEARSDPIAAKYLKPYVGRESCCTARNGIACGSWTPRLRREGRVRLFVDGSRNERASYLIATPPRLERMQITAHLFRQDRATKGSVPLYPRARLGKSTLFFGSPLPSRCHR